MITFAVAVPFKVTLPSLFTVRVMPFDVMDDAPRRKRFFPTLRTITDDLPEIARTFVGDGSPLPACAATVLTVAPKVWSSDKSLMGTDAPDLLAAYRRTALAPFPVHASNSFGVTPVFRHSWPTAELAGGVAD
jgi:hypothetical protein